MPSNKGIDGNENADELVREGSANPFLGTQVYENFNRYFCLQFSKEAQDGSRQCVTRICELLEIESPEGN